MVTSKEQRALFRKHAYQSDAPGQVVIDLLNDIEELEARLADALSADTDKVASDSGSIEITTNDWYDKTTFEIQQRVVNGVIKRFEETYRLTTAEMLWQMSQGNFGNSEAHQIWALYAIKLNSM